MSGADHRVQTMFQRDTVAAIGSVIAVWAVYAFVFWRMRAQFDGSGVTLLMLALAALVLLLNTAAIVALIRHYREDKAAIYGTDLYYLDRIAAERETGR